MTTTQEEKSYKSLKFIILRIATVALGNFSFGYSWTVYNQLFHYVKKVYNWPEKYENWISGAINSVFIFTAIFGCFFISNFKIFKRVKMMQFLDILAIVGTLCLLVVNNYFFGIGRIIQGFVAGGNSVLIPLFIKEFVPLELYSRSAVVMSLSIISGQVTAFLVGAPIDSVSNPNYWRVCLFPCILLPLFRFLLLFSWKFDTPYYYISINDEKNGRMCLNEIYKKEKIDEKFEMEKGVVTDDEMCKILKKKPHLKIVFIGVLLFLNQQFAGINAVDFYSTKVFKELGNGNSATYLTALWGIIDFVSITFSLFFVTENFNRKTLVNFGNITVGILLFFIGYISTTDSKTIALISFFVYIIVFNFSLGPLVWTIIGESVNSRIVPLPVSSHWVFAFIIAQFFPVMIDSKILGLSGTFYVFGVITFLSGLLLNRLLVESRGKEKIEILRLYNEGGEEEQDYESLEKNDEFFQNENGGN